MLDQDLQNIISKLIIQTKKEKNEKGNQNKTQSNYLWKNHILLNKNQTRYGINVIKIKNYN